MPSVITDIGRQLIAGKLAEQPPGVVDITTVKVATVAFVVNLDNAAVTDQGSGAVGLPATAHGVPDGAQIIVAGTTNYDGTYTVLGSSTTDRIDITATFAAETLSGATATVDPLTPPAPSASLTALEGAEQASVAVSGVGKIADDQVAYSGYLDTAVGDFTVNQVGYYADDGAGGLVLVMVHNIPPVYKRANAPGQSGNSYKHTGILNIAQAAEAAQVTIPPATWQFDWSDQLALKEDKANKGIGSGYASLDAGATVPLAQLPSGAGSGLDADTVDGEHASAFEHAANKGAADGYASLDAVGDVPLGQIPATLTGKDADLLDGQHGAFYQDAGNLNAGTLPAARFNDTAHGSRGGGSVHAAATTAVAGFMAAADKSKLDGIEPGATADQSATELLAAVKTVDGAGSGLDADRVDGEQASAFEHAANKGAANGYAGLDAGGRVVAPAALGTAPLSVTSTTLVPNLNADRVDGKHAGGANGLATLDAGGKLSENLDAGKIASGILPAARFNDTAHGNRGGGSLHAAATAAVAGFMAAADKSKLDGIEAGATADQTAAEIRDALKTVDGAGSGVDADLVDGLQASSFLRSDTNDESTGRQVLKGGTHLFDATGSRGAVEVRGPDNLSPAILALHRPNAYATYLGLDTDNQLKIGGWSHGANKYKIWSENNDGAGSGLDADTLDGQQASAFAAASHNHDAGNITGGVLALARIPATLTGKDADTVDGYQASALEKTANKGAANGYASLDASGDVPQGQMPEAMMCPIGAILAVAGTFSAANNGGVYNEAGVSVGANWKLCDGSLISDGGSPFNGRYVPKLDDGRFLRGNATAGGVGGAATRNPAADFAASGVYTPNGSVNGTTLTTSLIPAHQHQISGRNSWQGGSTGYYIAHNLTTSWRSDLTTVDGGYGNAHGHGWTGFAVSLSAWFNTSANIEPAYFNARFYQRIK